MTSASKSLHRQIEKWFGADHSAAIRISRTAAASNSRCITVSRPDNAYTIVFFRHGDGSWQVYPPTRHNPTFAGTEFAA